MINQGVGLHHYSLRKRIYKKLEKYPSSNKFKRFYDKFIYIIVILCPILNLPQLFKIWIDKDASGVSIFSWVGFTLISICWFIYGILHKDKHIIIMNLALVVVQTFILLLVYLYSEKKYKLFFL